MSGTCPMSALPIPAGWIIDAAIILAVIVIIWRLNRGSKKRA